MARILIIDDCPNQREQLRETLLDGCAPVVLLEAADGLQGLKLLMAEPVDLVLCDLEMPRLDGGKLLRMRDSSPGGANIPFLFLSASSDLDRRAKLLHDGASDVMEKPCHPPELVARVKLHLKIKRLQDELLQKNATLARLSTVDGLTGLRTRRYLDEVLNVELQRAQRYRTPLALLMCDLDHFKRVNDEHGHLAGDAVLRGVSQIIRDSLRGTDVAGRYGGEEIVIVLPQNNGSGAAVLAERLRESVAEAAFETPAGAKLGVTISVGIAEFDAGVQCPNDLVRRADRALYDAKNRGRNRIAAL